MELPMKGLSRFLRQDEGTTAIEYAVIASAIFFGILTVVQLLGTSVFDLFQTLVSGFAIVAN
jgi:Flp pilus assembly pilin Flp